MKGSQFPLDRHLIPLLVDPSAEDPWNYLSFDPQTGNMTPKYDPATNTFSPKGEATVRMFRLDRREALSIGYKKSFRVLNKILSNALDAQNNIRIVDEIIEHDEYGLFGWVTTSNIQNESPFAEFKAQYPDKWKYLIAYYHA
jgi:hypothetical protein